MSRDFIFCSKLALRLFISDQLLLISSVLAYNACLNSGATELAKETSDMLELEYFGHSTYIRQNSISVVVALECHTFFFI
jgi:hypothetical protein